MANQIRRRQNKSIAEILRRKESTPTVSATPDELISDAELNTIPEQYEDDGMTPILGRYQDRPGPTHVTGNSPVDYSGREDFRATSAERAAAGEGNSRVTGKILSRGQAPDAAFPGEEDEFADAQWNNEYADVDAAPTREQAAEKAMFDPDAESEWGGGGGWNYHYYPEEDGSGYIVATGPDGKTVRVAPGTQGRGGADAWASILTERFREGAQPLNAANVARPAEVLSDPQPGEPKFVGPSQEAPESLEQAAEAPRADIPAPGEGPEMGPEMAPYEEDPLAYFDSTIDPYKESPQTTEPAAFVDSPEYTEQMDAARATGDKTTAHRLYTMRKDAQKKALERDRLATIAEPIDWMQR
jgi:hypothetical protein